MGFVMQGLDKEDYDREYGDWVLIKRIFYYFKPFRNHLVVLTTGIALSALAATFIPVLTADAIDDLHGGAEISEVAILIYFVMGFAVLNFILNAVSQEITTRAVQGAVFNLRKDAFDALLIRDMSFFDDQPTGRIASRVTNDTNDFGTVVNLTSNLLGQILVVFYIMYFLFIRSVKLTILIMIFAPLVIITALSFRKIARTVSRNSQRILARVNALIQETTTGIYIAKSFRAEQYIYDEFDVMNKSSYSINLKRGYVFNSIFPILNILTNLGMAMIIYFGGVDLLNEETSASKLISFLPGKELSIGDWYLFLQGLLFFFFPLVSIASFYSQFQQGLAASERVFSMIDADNTVQQYDSKIIEQPKGEVEFNNLTFAYKEGTNILENFNLKINSGASIAIVGHTGAGKSTLVKLIARYYEFQNGELLIDGHDIRSLDLIEYRKKLSIISQEVFLFNNSIKDNLLYGIEETEDAERRLIEVLAKVEAMDWVKRLDKGLDTIVGERGGKLSMGQRQLIAFARILLRDPSLLILDEATSSVDPFTEIKIQNALNLILKGRTSIIIAHRLSTIKYVDRIIVMKDGKIIEEGSHNELLVANGHYAELYDTYFRHQSLEYIESIAD